ncbi:DNA-binding NarL/FixJ family response regulator [Lysinibacillus sp. RC46]
MDLKWFFRFLQKIGAENRTQAVVYAIRNRIVL